VLVGRVESDFNLLQLWFKLVEFNPFGVLLPSIKVSPPGYR
jgi:hypothetical protein